MVPTFVRRTQEDRYQSQQEILNAQQRQSDASNNMALLSLLKKCETTARPICFETIDVILRNKDADRMVRQMTGKPVDEIYR